MGETIKGAQIGCYLPACEAEELDRYASTHCLSRSRLCTLLVQREVNCRRLTQLKELHEGSIGKTVGVRVTTHAVSPTLKHAFSSHLEEMKIGRDDGAAILFRAELKERWLAEALGRCGNRS